MRRKTTLGVALAFLLLASWFLVFEVKLPEARALLFSDDFSNLNNWTIVKGVWTSEDGILQGTSGVGAEGLIWAGSTSWTNYKVTANVRAVISEAGVVVRYTDSGNFYWLGLGAYGHKYSISKVVNNSYRELASSGLASEVESDKWYLISAVAIDGTLQLFIDDSKVLEVQDSSLSNGALGFCNWNGSIQAKQLKVQPMLWSMTYGGAGGDGGNSVVQSSDGGYVIAGSTSSFGAGGSDVYLVKTDSSGKMLWSMTYGGAGGDGGNSVVQSSDGGYVIAGSTSSFGAGGSDVYLVKTDSSGKMLWSMTYGGAGGDGGNSVVQSSDGGYVIAGSTSSFGAGGSDVYLVKTDSSGKMLWSMTYGGAGGDGGNSVVQSSDGGYVIAGSTSSFGAGGSDVYLVKTDSSGKMLWSMTYGAVIQGASLDSGFSVVRTSDGGYAIGGATDGPPSIRGFSDFYLVKVDANGNMQWNKTYNGEGADFGESVVQTENGGYAIVGYTAFTNLRGGSEAYLVKTDSLGNELWSKIYMIWSESYLGPFGAGYSIILSSDGGYVIAGSTVAQGNKNYDKDVYLVKVPPDNQPFTVDNFDGLWHLSDFTIKLTATDDEFTTVSDTYYRINDGSTKSVKLNGQPVISAEGANNNLEYWSVDSLANEELPHNVLNGIKLDRTAPIGSIIINDGDDSTSSPSATLSLTYRDATSGVAQVRYSNDGVWDTESSESASASKIWTFTSGDGKKTVYYQIEDNAGLFSSTYSDTIILETPPTPTPTPTTESPNSSPSPSPNPTATPAVTNAPTDSPNQIPTPTPIRGPTENPAPLATSSLSPSYSSSPLPQVESAATSLYLYSIVVIAILAITISTSILILKKKK